MIEFFHGWRRKLGCVVLAMACTCCCGWVRSYFFSDLIAFPFFKRQHVIESIPNRIVWQSALVDSPNWAVELDSVDAHEMREILHSEQPQLYSSDPEYKQFVASLWIIPYGVITLTLTLLSAYLILWKPRKPTRASVDRLLVSHAGGRVESGRIY